MNFTELKIGYRYLDQNDELIYMGRFKVDLFIENEKGRKGERVFRLLSRKGSGLITYTKKEIEDLKEF